MQCILQEHGSELFTDKDRPEGLNVDYLYADNKKMQKQVQMIIGHSAEIGLSVNRKVFDEQYKDYLTFIVKNYSPAYFA